MLEHDNSLIEAIAAAPREDNCESLDQKIGRVMEVRTLLGWRF